MSIAFFGRLHPVLVHLPIGFILAAFLLDVLAAQGQKRMRVTGRVLIFWGALAAIASAVTGYLLSQEGGYDAVVLDGHQKGGIATAILSTIVWLLLRLKIPASKRSRRSFTRLLMFALVLLIIYTGHQGGRLTHGDNFITLQPETVIRIDTAQAMNPSEVVVFTHIIQPILHDKCTGCHGASRQKGNLRLDDAAALLKGGKHGHLLEAEGELLKRIGLDEQEKGHMPPPEKRQLTDQEKDILEAWVKGGADFEKRLVQYDSGSIFYSAWSTVSSEQAQRREIPPAPEELLAQLRATGVTCVPLAEGSNELEVSMAASRTISTAVRDVLPQLSQQVVRLRLSFCQLGEQDLDWLRMMTNVNALYLDHSNLNDQGLTSIAKLPLQYLNLTGTDITVKSGPVLQQMTTLRELFIGETPLAKEGIDRSGFHSGMLVEVGGAELPLLGTDTVVFKK